jgi:hypothetical protein
MGALLHSRVKAVQHGMLSQGISNTKNIQDSCELAGSWQVCFGIQEKSFMLIFFHMV